MPDTLPLPNLARVSPGVSRVSVVRVYDGGEPSSVTFAPRELRPFELRYRFWRMVDEELPDDDPRKRVWWLAGPPEAIPPDLPEPPNWTSKNGRDLADNAYAYRRYAECALDMHVPQMIQAREEMLSLSEDDYKRMRADELHDMYLVALEREVQTRREAGYRLDEIALRLGMSVETLHRRRREARRRSAEIGRPR